MSWIWQSIRYPSLSWGEARSDLLIDAIDHALPRVYQEASAIFRAGKDELFEDGMESHFSRRLLSLLHEQGPVALEVVSLLLVIYEAVRPTVTAEALRWLGSIDEPSSHDRRRGLLLRSLSSQEACIRDGAILGLSSLGDPQAIDSLRAAIQVEVCDELRKDMRQVLEELEMVINQ